MEVDDNFYDVETVSKIIDDLNTKNWSEIAELVDMNYGPKPEPELQRLIGVQVIAIDSGGLHLICNYHRWEMAEQNDRMFHEHTDETKRYYTIPFLIQPHSKAELVTVIEQMIRDAKASYLKGFE
jgi:hypothetical protein